MTKRLDQARELRRASDTAKAKNNGPHHIDKVNDLVGGIDAGLKPWERDLGADGIPRAIKRVREQNGRGFGASNDDLTDAWDDLAAEVERSDADDQTPQLDDIDGDIFKSA